MELAGIQGLKGTVSVPGDKSISTEPLCSALSLREQLRFMAS